MFLRNYEEKVKTLKASMVEKKEDLTGIEEQFVIIQDNLFEKDFQDLSLKYDKTAAGHTQPIPD
jgi:hypothetical protein